MTSRRTAWLSGRLRRSVPGDRSVRGARRTVVLPLANPAGPSVRARVATALPSRATRAHGWPNRACGTPITREYASALPERVDPSARCTGHPDDAASFRPRCGRPRVAPVATTASVPRLCDHFDWRTASPLLSKSLRWYRALCRAAARAGRWGPRRIAGSAGGISGPRDKVDERGAQRAARPPNRRARCGSDLPRAPACSPRQTEPERPCSVDYTLTSVEPARVRVRPGLRPAALTRC